MADDELPKPEPKEIDEKLALQLRHLAEDAVLKGVPYGDEKCANCLYYLEPDAKLVGEVDFEPEQAIFTEGGKRRATRIDTDAQFGIGE